MVESTHPSKKLPWLAEETRTDFSPKRNTRLANKHMKRRSLSFAIRETQMKTPRSYRYMLAGTAKIVTPNAAKDSEKLDHLCMAGGS